MPDEQPKEERKREIIVRSDEKMKYAVDQPDEVPPIQALRYLDEKGKFVEKKIDTNESNTMYWKSKNKTLMLLILLPALFYLLLILGATTKYQEGLWGLMSGAVNQVIGFFFGLIPKVG